MRLNKEEFVKYVRTYQDMLDRSIAVSNLMGISHDNWVVSDFAMKYYDFLHDMCELPINDKIGSDLDWWCFETDFGRVNNTEVVIEGKAGDKLHMWINTPEDLYDYIMQYVIEK